MANTRTLGEAITAISSGQFVKVKGVGILILSNRQRQRRRPKADKEEK